MLTNAARTAVNALGFEIISKDTAVRTYLPSYLSLLFADLSIRAVVDIGANIGQYGSLIRNRVGYAGPILSFEPVSKNFLELERLSQKDEAWSAYKLAIGSIRGDQEINVTKGGDLCSFLVPEGSSPALEVEMREMVKVETFQFVADRLTKMDIRLSQSFVKIDAQGLDYEIINGNADLIAQCAGLQIEAGTSSLYQGEHGFVEMIGLAQRLGFKLSRFFSGYEPSRFTPRYFDCFFVR
jgi:FkbM family methyltransferase